MPWSERRTSLSARYTGAACLAAAAVILRAAINPFLGNLFPFVTEYFAVLAAIRYLGAGPALLAIAVCTAGAPFFMPGPDWGRLALFAIVCLAVLWIVENFRRARARAEQNAALAAERLSQLETEVARRQQEERLSAQLRAIVESSEDAVISKDLDGLIRSWNHGAEQIYGYTEAEILGQNMSVLMPPGRIHEEQDLMERIRRGGRVKHFETVRVRKDGRQIQVSLTASPIRDSAGEVVGASHISRDITEQKEFEEQIRQTQKLESLGVLAGGLAHDFNNLLTGIMGNASLSIDEAGHPERIRQRATEILQASERAALLIRQMLAYAGKGRFVLERLDVAVQVREILPLLRTSIPRLVELDLELEDDLPRIEADASQIQQLIMNLAINAAEAVGDRPGRVTIAAFTRRTGDETEIVLQVKDTGCGMDEATKARIFDPFFTTKFTGRGLGLSAVLGIIRQHRGNISVETAPGAGSTFTVVFPAFAGPDAASGQSGEIRGYGLIQVVDDEELVRNMARFTLEHLGYSVETAADGREALSALAARPRDFAAILFDVATPGTAPDDVLRRIRGYRPDIPIVVSSSYPEAETVRRFEDLNLTGFLQKPYTATALARKIKQAVRSVQPARP